MHSYGIAQHIQKTSEDVLQVEDGSLYPALQGRRARFYSLTPAGKKQLGEEIPEFEKVMRAM
jgi:PadR family transcriptional regulator, regulatory protein PadR